MHNETNSYAVDFSEIDKTKLALVGGKGANLGELSAVIANIQNTAMLAATSLISWHY